MNVLVSMCLLGVSCKYNGKSQPDERILELLHSEKLTLIPVCPEQLGGLPTPRTPAERVNGGVFTQNGECRTTEYEAGAEEVLRLARLYDCKVAILKEKSPSCGNGIIYDGTFGHVEIPGDGVCAEVLKQNGIRVFGESDVTLFLEHIEFISKLSSVQ